VTQNRDEKRLAEEQSGTVLKGTHPGKGTNQNRQRQSRWKQMSRGRPKNGGCCCPELCEHPPQPLSVLGGGFLEHNLSIRSKLWLT